MSIASNYQTVIQRVRDACMQAGRDPHEVCIQAVSKTVDIDAVREAHECGMVHFGENRIEELIKKQTAEPELSWNFIGNIQSRKIKDIVAHAATIHSLYKYSHAVKIDECAKELKRPARVFLEVNISGETSKSGLSSDDVFEMMRECLSLEHIEVIGLMTMAPRYDNQIAREVFRGLYELKQEIQARIDHSRMEKFSQLSMGMTEDYVEAILEGSTCIRVGRGIFDEDYYCS